MSGEEIEDFWCRAQKEIAEVEAHYQAFVDTVYAELQKLMFEKYPELLPYRDALMEEYSEEMMHEIGFLCDMMDYMIGGYKGTFPRFDYPELKLIEYAEGTGGQFLKTCHEKTLEILSRFFPVVPDLLPNEIRYINASCRIHVQEILFGFYFLTEDYRNDSPCEDDDEDG